MSHHLETQKVIPTEEAVSEIRQASFHFADLYFHFAKALIEELGPEKGKELIERAVRNRAVERGEKLREKAIQLKLPLNPEGWAKVTDIPFTGWDKSYGRCTCPYAAAWIPRFDREPWFQEIARLYCNVNDPQVTESFTGNTSQRITRNVLNGDETCEREYFPIKGGNEK
jgi:L-2-amino-thiazoline-4-carboxylic acid hydrolase